MVKRLLLSLCSTLLVLMVLEIVARLVCEDDLYPPPREDVASPLPGCRGQPVPFGFIPLARIRSVYPDDPRGYFDEGNVIDHDFNRAGWRDTEHTLAKPPNTYRILGLGDSYLFGQGVRFEDICLARRSLRPTLRRCPSVRSGATSPRSTRFGLSRRQQCRCRMKCTCVTTVRTTRRTI